MVLFLCIGKEAGGMKKPKAFDSWQKLFPWLFFNFENGKVFCYNCRSAVEKKMPLPNRAKDINSRKAYVDEGFSTWGNALTCFRKHESCDFHKGACESLIKASQLNNAIIDHIKAGKNRQIKSNRIALMKIFDTIRVMARQGLAFRGDWDDIDGNLMQLLKCALQIFPS